MKDMDRSALYDLYIREGRFYQLGATLFQILWDGILAIMMLYAALDAVSSACVGTVKRRRRLAWEPVQA